MLWLWMVLTAGKTSTSYVIDEFHFQPSNFIFRFCFIYNIQHNEISKSYYSSEESEKYVTYLLRFQL